ncbi:MAG: LiaF domain-containing protein [Cyclobacteriaceae bacterium]
MKPIVKNKNILLGIILVVIGLLWFASNANMIHGLYFHNIFRWYYIVFIIGIFSLLTSRNLTSGIIMIAVALIFIVPKHFGYALDWSLVFPGILIFAGLAILFRRSLFSTRHSNSYNHYVDPEEIDLDKIDETFIFSGGDKIISSSNFKGGDVTCIFGGSEIDLTQAELSQGKSVLEIVAIFGGLTLIIPPQWNIKVEVQAIFGGFSDERAPVNDLTDQSRTLVIRGFVLFGGGDVKSYRGRKYSQK